MSMLRELHAVPRCFEGLCKQRGFCEAPGASYTDAYTQMYTLVFFPTDMGVFMKPS